MTTFQLLVERGTYGAACYTANGSFVGYYTVAMARQLELSHGYTVRIL